MTSKQFRFVKIVTAAILAIIFSQAVTSANYWLAGTAVIIAWIVIFILKKLVKEVMADERDYKNAGDAARWTLTIFTSIAALGSFILMSMRELGIIYETIGVVLAYSACGVMFLYSFIYMYLNKTVPTGRKIFFYIATVIMIIVFVLAGLRLFTAEDTWICQNGEWVKHGSPDSVMPSEICADVKSFSDGQEISWAEAENLIKTCKVKQVGQTHALEVSLWLKDGNKKLKTTEPQIDNVFDIINASKDKCGEIIMMTE